MTQEEILKWGSPIKPNSFETHREERWYRVGLYEGAKANPWNELTANGRRMPDNADVLVRLADGSIRRYEERFPELLVTHWMEIPKLPK